MPEVDGLSSVGVGVGVNHQHDGRQIWQGNPRPGRRRVRSLGAGLGSGGRLVDASERIGSVLSPPVDHLSAWLGGWPPALPVRVVQDLEHERPGWDGTARGVAGVADPQGRCVVRLPPAVAARLEVPLPDVATPSALGVDDWALRKRHTYGTVLVDLDRRRPVALLPGREAGTLAAWLREHPGVAVVSRDRAGAYARGTRTGAPGAVQVADRFHLLQNLAKALEVVFAAHAKDLRAVEQARREAMAAERGTVPIPPSEPQAEARVLAAARREPRLATHERVWELRGQGYSRQAIARHLGIHCSTVFRHLRSEGFAERKRRGDAGHSLLDPWQHIVLEHWNSGRRQGRQMFRTLQQDGYRGSYPTLARYLQRLRAAQGIVLVRKPAKRPRPVLVAAPRRVLTSRTAAWLVLRRVEKRSPDDQALLADLRRHAPELDEAIALGEAFTGLIRDRAPDRLDPWLRQARDSTVRQLRSFAKGLQGDYAAVRAAAALAWSNGPVEGQINRLKTLKRQMYGRANLDLLERRFLLAA